MYCKSKNNWIQLNQWMALVMTMIFRSISNPSLEFIKELEIPWAHVTTKSMSLKLKDDLHTTGPQYPHPPHTYTYIHIVTILLLGDKSLTSVQGSSNVAYASVPISFRVINRLRWEMICQDCHNFPPGPNQEGLFGGNELHSLAVLMKKLFCYGRLWFDSGR